MSILRKILGKTKTDYEDAALPQPKDKDYFQIDFQNYEHPERSFSMGSDNPLDVSDHPLNIFFTKNRNEKNTPIYNDSETKFILKPKPQKKKLANIQSKDSGSEQSLLKAPENSMVLSEPSVIKWKNKDAYIYRVGSTRLRSGGSGGDSHDLEFVIYIPIDTAVKWLTSTIDKTSKDTKPEYISEQSSIAEHNRKSAISEKEINRQSVVSGKEINRQSVVSEKEMNRQSALSEKEIKYGVEEDEEHENKKYSVTIEKNESISDAYDSGDEDGDEDEDEDEEKNQAKPSKLKQKKVKGPKIVKKKARRIITTYEEDDDEIDLGQLRPKKESEPVKIIPQQGNKLY